MMSAVLLLDGAPNKNSESRMVCSIWCRQIRFSSVRDGKTPHFDYITFVFDEYYEYLTNNLINKRTEQE